MKKVLVIVAAMLLAAPAMAAWDDVHVNDANTLALYHMDEGSGLVVGDASSNGNDGTMTTGLNYELDSALSWATSMQGFGTALSAYYTSSTVYNCGSVYIDQNAENDNTLSGLMNTDLTLEFWMNPNNAGGSWGSRVLKHYTGGEFNIGYKGGFLSLQYYGITDPGNSTATGWVTQIDDTTMTVDAWTHVAITIDRTNSTDYDTIKFWYNGVLANTYTLGACTSASSNAFVALMNDGYGTLYPARQFTGMLDEVRISDTIRYGAVAIPEPATMSLLAVAALALFRRK